MDTRLTFTLIAFLGSLWALLFSKIPELTVHSPGAAHLLPLAYAHYIVGEYLLLTLMIFYSQGITAVGFDAPRYAHYVQRLVFGSWPVALTATAVGFITAPAGGAGAKTTGVVVTFAVALLLILGRYFPIRAAGADADAARKSWWLQLAMFLGLASLLFVPYLMATSVMLADVQVTFDRDSYTEREGELTVTVRRGGYVFCPKVKAIECGQFRRDTDGDGAFIIPLASIGRADYFLVDYQPQLLSSVWQHVEPVAIAQRLPK